MGATRLGRILRPIRRVAATVRRQQDRSVTIPRRWMGSQGYAERSDATWTLAAPAAPIERHPPERYGAIRAGWKRSLPVTFPDMGVLELREAYLVGPRGWVVTRDGYVLPEHSIFGSGDQMPIRERRIPVTRVSGTVVSLASDNAHRNYGHFLYDGLGRFELLQRAGIPWSDADWFYVGWPGAKARRLVERLGIPAERMIRAEQGAAIQADRVLAPTFPGVMFDHPSWIIDSVRRNLLPAQTPSGPTTRLYVARTKSRRIANEDEVMPILQRYGFMRFDPDEHDEPLAAFARAEAVVGVHGANLADIAFCPTGARLLELTPAHHLHPYWYVNADPAGLRYGHIICRSVDTWAPGAWKRGDRDVHVEPDELTEALDAMGLG